MNYNEEGFKWSMHLELTVMVDGTDESEANICVVIGDEDNIKELLAVGIKLPQLRVDSLQSLGTRPNTNLH